MRPADWAAIIGQVSNLLISMTALLTAMRAHNTINVDLAPKVTRLERAVNGALRDDAGQRQGEPGQQADH